MKLHIIKSLITDHIKNNVFDSEIAVLLSGGCDSLSCALAAHEVGLVVNAYSFHLDTHETYDYQMAKKASKIMGWNFTEVSVPTNNLENDWFRLRDLGAKKKTHYECMWPFIHLYPKIKEKYVLTGWGADGYHGVSKKAVMHYKNPKEKFDQFRDDYFLPEKTAGLKWHLTVAEKHDKIMVNPYLDEKVKEYFYQFTWDELNKPKQKQATLSNYNDYFSKVRVRKHTNLQLGDSKIETNLEQLLKSDWNINNYKSVVGIFNDLNRGVIN